LLQARFTEEEIETILTLDVLVCRVNRLAMTSFSLIPTDSATGKPLHPVALVRVYESSPEYVGPMREGLDALRAMPGVRELTPDEAKRRARELDNRLGDGEAEYFVNPTEENEIDGLADFYEREIVRLRRLKPEMLPTLEDDIKRYAQRAKSLGRTEAERRFKRLMS